MAFLDQPVMRASVIEREPHLTGNIPKRKWIKPFGSLSKEYQLLNSANEIKICRTITKGTICTGDQVYRITDEHDQQIFSGIEESSCCSVLCCGPARSYAMQIDDTFGTPYFNFHRPMRCDDTCWCCCGCGLMSMRVTTHAGNEIGDVAQKWSFWRDKFLIRTASKDKNLTIYGPCLTCRCLPDMSFQVVSEEGNEVVAEIWKRWEESKEKNINEDHEHCGITFKRKVSSDIRVLLIAATFLLNHMFFEMS